MAIKDTQGNTWEEAGVNQFQQRLLRCISGERAGDIIFDPRCGPPPEPREQLKRKRDPWIEGLYEPSRMFDD